ncbi:MAG: imidazole glycerol phosphate synthase subunit HisH [Oscillospiraceae bacterium]|nr:imidazole glycerol phosphate synthase subunit HisH [Oscillospiraceae bacterium]
MTVIIDYGVGNLFSLSSSLRHIGTDCTVSGDPETVRNAERIILPGVGAFGDAMAKLSASGLIPALDHAVRSEIPLLGICLGMQLLFEESSEYGVHLGLGFIPGKIRPLSDDFPRQTSALKTPHMGWNSLDVRIPEHPLMKFTKNADCVYFVHSFYAVSCEEYIVSDTEYGVKIPAVVALGNVFGCQFHPEKSGKTGLDILRAFTEIN